MKISVVMVDGQFREHTFGAEHFGAKQEFADHEVIWVEFYERVPARVRALSNVEVVTLGNPAERVYHSSYCFNEGIRRARGELIVIPDADQIVRPDFLRRVWELHQSYERLVAYVYRYDETERGALTSFDFDELDAKCVLKNPINYGGCLTVRKKWLEAINGYEQHPIFATGLHANGLNNYTRFKCLGLAITWARELKLYHPWHENTLSPGDQYVIQRDFIDWRHRELAFLAVQGIDPAKNDRSFDEAAFMTSFRERHPPQAPAVAPPAPAPAPAKRPGLLGRLLDRL